MKGPLLGGREIDIVMASLQDNTLQMMTREKGAGAQSGPMIDLCLRCFLAPQSNTPGAHAHLPRGLACDLGKLLTSLNFSLPPSVK